MVVLEFRVDPFALGFEEQSKGVGADVDAVGDCVMDAWDRLVCVLLKMTFGILTACAADMGPYVELVSD